MDPDPGRVLDELLVTVAQTGSRAAFTQMVVRWTPRLRRHAGRLLRDPDAAGDAVQDAWLDIARGLRRIEDPARFAGWAYAVTSRRCFDAIRRRGRERRLSAAMTAEGEAGDGAADGRAASERRLDLAAAIGRLPLEQRLVVSLFYGEDLSVEDIAAAHRLAPGTVKSRLFAARQTLKSHLETYDHDPC